MNSLSLFSFQPHLPVLLGQRGNDHLETGSGNDLAIGDQGSNSISTNLDFPRMYQIFRSMESKKNYAPGSTDLGFVFMSKYDLNPAPHRIVDSQASIIDELISIDDASDDSHLVRDILGISGSIRTTGLYCMKPLFTLNPGFVSETGMLHGSDTIITESGDDFIIGDDIRGFSAFDLTQFQSIEDSRIEIDKLINDLSVRISTIGYDAIHHTDYANSTSFDTKEYEINVGCDEIQTNSNSAAFITGDSLNIIGRTFMGSYFQDPSSQVRTKET